MHAPSAFELSRLLVNDHDPDSKSTPGVSMSQADSAVNERQEKLRQAEEQLSSSQKAHNTTLERSAAMEQQVTDSPSSIYNSF